MDQISIYPRILSKRDRQKPVCYTTLLPLYSTVILASEKSALSAAWFVSINADLENWCD
jgi:hypothetical protein